MNLIPKMQRISMQYHIDIYKAVQSRDPENSARQMKNHIENIKQSYHQYSMVSDKSGSMGDRHVRPDETTRNKNRPTIVAMDGGEME